MNVNFEPILRGLKMISDEYDDHDDVDDVVADDDVDDVDADVGADHTDNGDVELKIEDHREGLLISSQIILNEEEAKGLELNHTVMSQSSISAKI